MLQLRTSCTTRSKVDGIAGENYKVTPGPTARLSSFSEPGNSPTPLGQPTLGLRIAIGDLVYRDAFWSRSLFLLEEDDAQRVAFSACFPSVSQAPENGLAPPTGVFDKDRPATPNIHPQFFISSIDTYRINNDSAQPIHSYMQWWGIIAVRSGYVGPSLDPDCSWPSGRHQAEICPGLKPPDFDFRSSSQP